MQNLATFFTQHGAQFANPIEAIAERLGSIQAFVFDWDGVFNDGTKDERGASPFSEADSMGVNMLRFGYWLQRGHLPTTAIITGELNPAAQHLAQREHFSAIYYKIKHKTDALAHLCTAHHLQPAQVCFTFDDILDVAVAQQVGLRLLVRRDASPLFADYLRRHTHYDYRTAQPGQLHAVREVCELLLGCYGHYDDVLAQRIAFGEVYQNYLTARAAVHTHFYTTGSAGIVPSSV